MSLSWRISGDLGDAIFTLCLLKTVGGKNIIRCVDRPGITAPFVPRVPLIRSLFEAQPYVSRVECSEEPVNVDLVAFRRWHSSVTTLIEANAAEYQMQTAKYLHVDGSEPWLTVEPDPDFSDKIIIARSPRYNNSRFPWKKVVEHYGPRLIFVGLQQEHEAFVASFGQVPHLRVMDFLQLARAIAGSALFIGNQSSPHAVALGLGHRIISEVSDQQPDCIYRRDNVQYVCDGGCILPDIDGSGELEIIRYIDVPESINVSCVPPGFWQYPGLPAQSHFMVQRGLVMKKENCTDSDASKMLFQYNAARCPTFFTGTDNDPMGLFKIAHRNAFKVQEPVLQP